MSRHRDILRSQDFFRGDPKILGHTWILGDIRTSNIAIYSSTNFECISVYPHHPEGETSGMFRLNMTLVSTILDETRKKKKDNFPERKPSRKLTWQWKNDHSEDVFPTRMMVFHYQEWWFSITMLVFWGAFPIKEEWPDVFITAHVRYSRAFPSDPTINNFTKHLHPNANPMMDPWDDGVYHVPNREGNLWDNNGKLVFIYCITVYWSIWIH